MRYSNGYSHSSSAIGVYPIAPSKTSSRWMMTTFTCSTRNCCTRNIPSPMTLVEVSSGLASLEESKNQPLLNQHSRLQPSKTYLPKPNYPPHITHQKPNVVNSPSCSATSLIPPHSPASSIPK